MKELDLIEKQRSYGDERFVVTRVGKFFSAYGCGAFALSRATGYRVMRRQRKGGAFVLTTGFPESSLDSVIERIERFGGIVEIRDDRSFVFAGIDGSEDEALVKDARPTPVRADSGGSDYRDELDLRSKILSFDLSSSTPMDAMNFIYSLQRIL